MDPSNTPLREIAPGQAVQNSPRRAPAIYDPTTPKGPAGSAKGAVGPASASPGGSGRSPHSSPRAFWLRDPLSPGNESPTPSPSRRRSLERLKMASRVKNSSMLARESKNEYDPTSAPLVLDRPLAKGRPLRDTEISPSKQGTEQDQDRELTPTPSRKAIRPVAKAEQAASRDVTSENRDIRGNDDDNVDTNTNNDDDDDDDDQVMVIHRPEGSPSRSAMARPLRRHAKSVTFDPSPQIKEFELITPERSSVSNFGEEDAIAMRFRGGSDDGDGDDDEEWEYEYDYDEQRQYAYGDESFDASLEDTDKTPVVMPMYAFEEAEREYEDENNYSDEEGQDRLEAAGALYDPEIQYQPYDEYQLGLDLGRFDSDYFNLDDEGGEGENASSDAGSNEHDRVPDDRHDSDPDRHDDEHHDDEHHDEGRGQDDSEPRPLPIPIPDVLANIDVNTLDPDEPLPSRESSSQYGSIYSSSTDQGEQAVLSTAADPIREPTSSIAPSVQSSSGGVELAEELDVEDSMCSVVRHPSTYFEDYDRYDIRNELRGLHEDITPRASPSRDTPTPQGTPQQAPSREPVVPAGDETPRDTTPQPEMFMPTPGRLTKSSAPSPMARRTNDRELSPIPMAPLNLTAPSPASKSSWGWPRREVSESETSLLRGVAGGVVLSSEKSSRRADVFLGSDEDSDTESSHDGKAEKFGAAVIDYFRDIDEESVGDGVDSGEETEKERPQTPLAQVFDPAEYKPAEEEKLAVAEPAIQEEKEDLDLGLVKQEEQESLDLQKLKASLTDVETGLAGLAISGSETEDTAEFSREFSSHLSEGTTDEITEPDYPTFTESDLSQSEVPVDTATIRAHGGLKTRPSLTAELRARGRVPSGSIKLELDGLGGNLDLEDDLARVMGPRSYLMRQNTKIVVASDRPRMSGASAAEKRQVSGPWTTEAWNGTRRQSTRRGHRHSAAKRESAAASAIPPMPAVPAMSKPDFPMPILHGEPEDAVDRGRLFVKVVGVQDMDLPLPDPKKEVVPFRLTVDNGLHCVTTNWKELGRSAAVGQEFELVVGGDLEFQLTLQMRLVPRPSEMAPIPAEPDSPSKRTTFARLLGSPRKKKAASREPSRPPSPSPSGYDMLHKLVAEDGSFARAYVCLKPHEQACYGRPVTFSVPCFNEWALQDGATLESSVRSKRGAILRKPPYRIGRLLIGLMFIPKTTVVNQLGVPLADIMPRSMGAAAREMERARLIAKKALEPPTESTETTEVGQSTLMDGVSSASTPMISSPRLIADDAEVKEGHLTQLGGDCPYWRRRFFKLDGSRLTGYHETTRQPRATINLSKATSMSDGRGKVKRRMSRRGSERKSIDDDDIFVLVEHAFRIRFGNGESIDFAASSDEEKNQWLNWLGPVIGKKLPPGGQGAPKTADPKAAAAPSPAPAPQPKPADKKDPDQPLPAWAYLVLQREFAAAEKRAKAEGPMDNIPEVSEASTAHSTVSSRSTAGPASSIGSPPSVPEFSPKRGLSQAGSTMSSGLSSALFSASQSGATTAAHSAMPSAANSKRSSYYHQPQLPQLPQQHPHQPLPRPNRAPPPAYQHQHSRSQPANQPSRPLPAGPRPVSTILTGSNAPGTTGGSGTGTPSSPQKDKRNFFLNLSPTGKRRDKEKKEKEKDAKEKRRGVRSMFM